MPHRWRHFQISKDPEFEEKTLNITGLYMNPPDRAVVLSINGKTQTQALTRTQKGLSMKPGRPATMMNDYKGHGTTNLFATLNILDGKVIGRYSKRHRSQELIGLLDQVERTVPARPDPTIRSRAYLSSGMDALTWIPAGVQVPVLPGGVSFP